MFGDLVALGLVMFLIEKVILMVAVMSMVMVTSMVTVTVIVIPVQEATFASGGKNKAVRKSVP